MADRLTQGLRGAVMLLTRLPLPASPRPPAGPSAAWAWPLAGIIVAGLAAVAAAVALWAGVPAGPAAALALAVQIMATGAMHEDGLADTADGFWGGWTRERRLEIMKDSRIGSYGVLALVIVGLMRWSALAHAFDAGWVVAPLIASAALSRVPMAALMAGLPNARGTGLSQSLGRPSGAVAAKAAGVATLAALAFAGWGAVPMALAVAAVALAVAALARAKIGGQTGDVLGAAQQLAEAASLAVFCALI
ncbi:adenosylcobinamide-GDP ribazoletransferase [Aliigemmobacter aestuarii]|uniref:Adenosylcobinamide-GDP ribazoletransferase n=1 Tax=Aliigemmobacter aestuarii TaxID=1445661 RepID=A0A4S3MUF9_9RHOB|nr:adenosylcobinamide-GDP ribazoletransferase [Gemmobacter aestuarii]THD85813.1 adenosylcobinamide-GDP ribazoletransferase [Gemmobacter aestuarii]